MYRYKLPQYILYLVLINYDINHSKSFCIFDRLKIIRQFFMCTLFYDPLACKPKSRSFSPIIISASEAKLAVTPPNVGSHITEIYNDFFLSCSYTAADVFAIYIREITPSCILTPPEAENVIIGRFFFVANRKTRATFSLVTTHMLPVINNGSKTAITHLCLQFPQSQLLLSPSHRSFLTPP